MRAMEPKRPYVLGIETSCDDTACAVLDGDGRVLASVVSSQLKAHRPFGGVVPEIASREHLSNWPAVSAEAVETSGVRLDELDVVAATRGPGLIGCLLVGLSVGRALASGLERPFHGVHHLEGHLYSPFLLLEGEPAMDVPERFVGLVVSGGHTSLLDVDGGQVHSLVETRDDAMGEVFDKVGKRLGLGYPQGPKVDRLAEMGTVSVEPRFTVPKVKHDRQGAELFYSFSGLKTQSIREIEALERQGVLTDARPDDVDGPWPQEALDLMADFRQAAVAQIIDRLDRQRRRQPFEVLAVSGGAAANRLLRRRLEVWADDRGVRLFLVPLKYSGDNAAMIAFAALLRHRRGEEGNPLDAANVAVASRIPFSKPASAAD